MTGFQRIALLTLLSALAAPASANDDLIILKATPQHLAVVDTERFGRSEDQVTVGVRYIFAYPKYVSDDRTSSGWAQGEISEMQFRCSTNQYREVSVTLYGFDNQPIATIAPDTNWRALGEPTSVASFAHDLTCNANDVGFEHRASLTDAAVQYYDSLRSSFSVSAE